MQYHGGGVGHLGTCHCDKMLLADEHAPPDIDIIKPSTNPDEDQDSDDEAEGWWGEDRDVGDEEDNNDEQVTCYEWMARVTRLESCCSCRGGFGFGFDAAGP